MENIKNPILPGFNPDPSILRVGDDYYIANSTFEWFPGVQIWHSRDLKNWRLIAHPLNRVSQLDMEGNISSGGIWAPCLSYDNGIFYLIYTDGKTFYSVYKDTNNYLVTSNDITGDWSEPIYLNSSGFDPSLFHDDDGRKWLVNMEWDHRKSKNRFKGILLQEYSSEEKSLVGPIVNIFLGTELGCTEGPHLYKVNGFYYLMVAEGGTGYEHAVTIARSKSITGPYEVDPENPMLTSWGNPSLKLQKAGHASLVQTQKGEWYMTHLCGRPLTGRQRCVLGRETGIQKVVWSEDKWLRLEGGGNNPFDEVPAPDLPEHKWPQEPSRDDFNTEKLNINFQTMRVPLKEDTMSLVERPGYLRLKGRESLSSKHHQALVARRQQHFCYTAATCLEFEPDSYKQMAGLVCIYDVENFYYLRMTQDEDRIKCLGIVTCDNNDFDEPLAKEVCIDGWKRCYLKAEVDYDRLQFYYSGDIEEWKPIGPAFDYSTLSDEYCREGNFTGAFVGICCQDLTGRRKAADFDYFEYTGRD